VPGIWKISRLDRKISLKEKSGTLLGLLTGVIPNNEAGKRVWLKGGNQALDVREQKKKKFKYPPGVPKQEKRKYGPPSVGDGAEFL